MMLHIGRVGSTVLAEMLDQHSQIKWDGEVLEPEHGRYMVAATEDSYRLPDDPLWQLKYGPVGASTKWYGAEIKFMREHHLRVTGMDLADLIAALEAMGYVKFIVMRRLHLLRRCLSGAILRHKGYAHRRTNEAERKNRIYFDLNAVPLGRYNYPLLDCFDMIESQYRELDELLAERNVLQLVYEQHIEPGPTLAYNECCAFLGLEPEPAEVTQSSVNPHPISELVENYDDVAKLLRDTRHAWMLNDA